MPARPVLHVTPYGGDAWGYGGIPRVVAAEVRELAARGVEVVVATTDACTASARLARPPDAPSRGPWATRSWRTEVRVFPNLSNRLAHDRQLFLPLGLRGWLEAHAGEFALAHLHGCHNLPGALAARRLQMAGVPYVLQPNGTAPRIERRRLAKLLFDRTVGRGVLSGAARVIAVSEAERGDLLALGVPAGRVVVIPNPVEAVGAQIPERGALRARLGLGDGPLVVYLGQLTPRKRVGDLLEAVARIASPSVRLLVAGPDRGCLDGLRRQAAALGLADRVSWAGVLEGADRLATLADADLVAYPSEREVFGLVPLEALLVGTPVVVGADSGCGEVVGRTGGGLLVAPGQPVALAAAISTVLSDPATWRCEAAQAAVTVRELFAPAVVAERLAELYASVERAP